MIDTAKRRTRSFMTGIALLLPITFSVIVALFVAPIAPKIAETFALTGQYSPEDLGWYIRLDY